MQYSNAQLLDMLLELDAEEIIKVDEEFKAGHPYCPTLSFICHMALGMKLKKDDANRDDLVALIQKAKSAWNVKRKSQEWYKHNAAPELCGVRH